MSDHWEKPRKRSNVNPAKDSEKHLVFKIRQKLKSLTLFKKRMGHRGIDDRVAEELWKRDQKKAKDEKNKKHLNIPGHAATVITPLAPELETSSGQKAVQTADQPISEE